MFFTLGIADDGEGGRQQPLLDPASSALGFFAIIGLSIAFGTMYLPVKRHNMGNGMFFQWIMCVSMAVFSMIIHLSIGSPKIWPLATISGFSWATGNVAAIPIMRRLGMGVGILIWSMVNLLVGWASSRFGWFGIQPEVPRNNVMNILGVAIAAASAILYVFIKPPSTRDAYNEIAEGDSDAGNTDPNEGAPLITTTDVGTPSQRFWNSSKAQRMIGLAMAVVAGFFYGIVFVPIIYTQETTAGASQRGIDYLASIGLGAFLASTLYFVLYGLITRNRPLIPKASSILPALLSGVLCSIGQSGFLVANEILKASIVFPIAATVPGAIAALIGTVFYREVQGRRNYIKLALALTLTFTGSILTGLSNGTTACFDFVMPYVTSTGEIRETEPWSINYVTRVVGEAFEVISLFCLSQEIGQINLVERIAIPQTYEQQVDQMPHLRPRPALEAAEVKSFR